MRFFVTWKWLKVEEFCITLKWFGNQINESILTACVHEIDEFLESGSVNIRNVHSQMPNVSQFLVLNQLSQIWRNAANHQLVGFTILSIAAKSEINHFTLSIWKIVKTWVELLRKYSTILNILYCMTDALTANQKWFWWLARWTKRWQEAKRLNQLVIHRTDYN